MAKVEKGRSNESTKLSFYIHIPYCTKRCGYCDFNTYTPGELNSPNLNLITSNYIDAALKEIEQASIQLGQIQVETIFFGGGTPSLLPPYEVSRVISKIANHFEIRPNPEITLEANPDNLNKSFLESIRSSGVNRISIGMQSAVPHVLRTLDRTHNPENVVRSCELVRESGFEHLSVDLIYGTPGESLEDWQESFESAFQLPIDHISAYALIVENGTKLAAQVKRGELQMPPDDETAEKYLQFDAVATRKGFNWYELSNWAIPGAESLHNKAYWNGSFWWGVGPGAHSFIDGRRWWNVKHPTKYQELIKQNKSPKQDSEVLSEENIRDEFVMLRIRTREGIELDRLSDKQLEVANQFKNSGYIERSTWSDSRLVLTAKGRLIADRIVRELLV
jgi:putative oxygen-independent coproporphyrinogen III oxidase